jgi:anthranilate/para-aminobenzoate synthase component I
VRGRQIVRRDSDGAEVEREHGDALLAIERFAARHGHVLDTAAPTTEPPPWPRVMGYLGYELARHVEALGPRRDDDDLATIPDAWLGAYPAVMRWPRRAGRDEPGELVGDAAAVEALRRHLERGDHAPGPAPRFGPLVGAPDDRAAHLARVAAARAYIEAGDVYQVNLARRLQAAMDAPGDGAAVLAALLAEAPASYAAMIEADGTTVLSGSPELFIATGPHRYVVTRPIKGTRARGATLAADAEARLELTRAPKDHAEHVMIVDLERNDLGRVAEIGSVVVERLAYGVDLPQVHHLVSSIRAQLRPSVGLAELLRATFPGGSITGAPKVRALQIIDELEAAPRGPYCGAIGYFGADGQLCLSIAIRIATLTSQALHVHVGGGIVADSDPRAEFDETEAKAAGWRQTLARLAAGR